jgi:hypothetical protein
MVQPQPGGRPESEAQRDLKLTCMSNLLSIPRQIPPDTATAPEAV